MMRWLVLAVVVVVLTALATLVANFAPAARPGGAFQVSSRSGPAPRAAVDGDPVHDFGKMSQKTTGTHAWTVRNEGTAPLEVWMQSSTCQCTIAKFRDGGRAAVAPGESTQIELEWETRDSIGEFNKGATIGTNDPNQPSFVLTVRGIVHPAIVVIPNERVVPMGQVSSEESKLAHVAFFAPDQPDMKILKVATSKPDRIVATPVPLSETELKPLQIQGGYKLDLEIKPGMPIGNFLDELVVTTDNPIEPEVRIKVMGSVSGPISVIPDRLRLVNVTSGKGGAGEASLLVRGGTPTTFEIVQKPDKVNVEISLNETPSLKGRYRLKVTVPPGTPAGRIEETILLKTNHPQAAELKVPIDILVLGDSAG